MEGWGGGRGGAEGVLQSFSSPWASEDEGLPACSSEPREKTTTWGTEWTPSTPRAQREAGWQRGRGRGGAIWRKCDMGFIKD